MKKPFFLIVFSVFLMSCTPKIMLAPNGELVTERKFKRINEFSLTDKDLDRMEKKNMRYTKKFIKNLSPEDKEFLNNLKVVVEYDSI